MTTRILGASFATTAALIAVAGVTTATPAVAKGAAAVHCYGINSCKGTSDCKTAANECKGQNACKGPHDPGRDPGRRAWRPDHSPPQHRA